MNWKEFKEEWKKLDKNSKHEIAALSCSLLTAALLIFIELKSVGSLRCDLDEARSRIRELEDKHAQEEEKCENNRA